MKVVAIVQARTGSTRLPGKVMKTLQDKPVLMHIIDRCRAVRNIDDVVIATTIQIQDQAIVELCNQAGVAVYRGSEHDVLSRYYEAAVNAEANVIVRITSDCPLLDPLLTEEVVAEFLAEPDLDYCNNWIKPSLPVGLSVEVFSFKALEYAFHHAATAFDREHVTPYLHDHPELFRLKHISYGYDYGHYRWTLDTPEDFTLIQRLYEKLYVPGQIFGWQEGINLMQRNPEWAFINTPESDQGGEE